MDRKPGHLIKKPQENVNSLVWVKLVGVGNANSGKTCLIKHFCESKFSSGYQPTVGVDYGFKIQTVDGTDLRVHLWDLAGNPEYLDVRNELYSGADAVFLVYDVTNPVSFESLDVWLREIHKYTNSNPDIILVANKIDLKPKRVVTVVEGRKWAKEHKIMHYETSSSTGEGVGKLFTEMLTRIAQRKTVSSG